MSTTNKVLITIIIVLIVSIGIVIGLMGFASSNSSQYTVGNSTFSVPKEYELNPIYKVQNKDYGYRIFLNSTEKDIDVTEFTSKEKMDERVSSFRIPDRTIRGDLLYKEQKKNINGTDVIRFEDTGMPFKYYFFEKNGKYYGIDIYLPDNSNIHDELATMIISTLKNKSDNPLNTIFR